MKILIVEDEQDILDYLSEQLSDIGYTTICAGDGKLAIDLALKQSPDIILLDLKIPKIDGLTVCRTLKKKIKTPIIILSAKAQSKEIEEGYAAGADNYLIKPISFPKLLEELNKWKKKIEG